MFSCGVCEVFRDWCLRTTASETCCFTWRDLKLAQIGTWFSLREKCPNMEFFLVCIFLQLGWIRRDTKYWVRMREYTDQEKTSIWKLFTQRFVLQFTVSLTNSHLITIIPWNYNANTINWYCYNQKQSSGGVLTNFTKFTRKHLP